MIKILSVLNSFVGVFAATQSHRSTLNKGRSKILEDQQGAKKLPEETRRGRTLFIFTRGIAQEYQSLNVFYEIYSNIYLFMLTFL